MTDHFDNFEINPNAVGSDWKFSGGQAVLNQGPLAKMANYDYWKVGERFSFDRTRTVFAYEHGENPERTINDAWLGWGVDWAQFNYNPYGKLVGQSPLFKVHNDYLLITGLGGIDIKADDVMDKDQVEASGMVHYYNYPTEGYNSFGKKGDKRWAWQGNSWIPAV